MLEKENTFFLGTSFLYFDLNSNYDGTNNPRAPNVVKTRDKRMNCELSPSEDYLRNKLLRSASEEGLNIPSTPEFSCDGNLILI